MSSSQMQAADFQPPKQRSIYLTSEFAELFMCSRNALAQKILQWVACEEMHQDGGKHFHMAMETGEENPMVGCPKF